MVYHVLYRRKTHVYNIRHTAGSLTMGCPKSKEQAAGIEKKPETNYIKGKTMSFEFTSKKQQVTYHVIMETLRDEWPLTLRQVHYELVTQQACKNTKGAYNNLSAVLVEWRIDGIIPWEAITDYGRPLYDFPYKAGVDYWQDCRTELLRYRRDLLQNQPKRVEVWVEKMALVTRFRRICDPLTVPVQVLSGFVSIDKIKDFVDRSNGGETTILLFTDHDPSGLAMQAPLERRLAQIADFGVEVLRVGLNKGQVKNLGLIPNFDAIKDDSRAKAYIAAHGQDAWEMDALRPEMLSDILTPILENLLDYDLIDEQSQIEDVELANLQKSHDDMPNPF